MKKVLFASLLLSSSAFAQNVPQEYIPWQFDQGDAQVLGQALGDIPAKYSLPIIQWLNEKEVLAMKRKELEVKSKPKAEELKPEAPKPEVK